MSVKKNKNEDTMSLETLPNGVVLAIMYLAFFAVSSVVVYFANMWFPEAVVMGTNSISPTWAYIHALGTLALLVTFSSPFLHLIEMRRNKDLTSVEWMIAYFVVNAVGLWIITRFSEQFGMGVSSWIVIVILALVLDFVQGLLAMSHERTREMRK